jgi:outer membrane protein W
MRSSSSVRASASRRARTTRRTPTSARSGVSGSLGAEYFFTKNFSIQAAHGLIYTSTEAKTGTVKVKTTNLTSEAFGVSNIGFHYYFGGK